MSEHYYIKLSDHLAELAKRDKEIERLKSGNVKDGAFIFPLSKKGCLRHAIGFYTKEAVLADTETIIVNDGSFAAFNFRLSPEEMQRAVDSQDEAVAMRTGWETKA